MLRLDAVSDAVLALFLLAASWDRLYEALGLPVPEPAFYAQLVGAALVALAAIEWSAAGGSAQRLVARGVAAGRFLGAAVLAAWLLAGTLELESHGAVVLWSIAGSLALEGILHARVWLRDSP